MKLFWIGVGQGGAAHALEPTQCWERAEAICGAGRVEVETDLHGGPCIVDNPQEDLSCTPCRLLVAEGNGDEDATELLDWAADKARADEERGDNSNVTRHARMLEHLAKAIHSIDYDDPEDGSEALAEWVAYEIGLEAADDRWEPLFHENNWTIVGIRYTLGGLTVDLKVAPRNDLQTVAEGN